MKNFKKLFLVATFLTLSGANFLRTMDNNNTGQHEEANLEGMYNDFDSAGEADMILVSDEDSAPTEHIEVVPPIPNNQQVVTTTEQNEETQEQPETEPNEENPIEQNEEAQEQPEPEIQITTDQLNAMNFQPSLP